MVQQFVSMAHFRYECFYSDVQCAYFKAAILLDWKKNIRPINGRKYVV
jgi:hypothetical protein